MNLLHKLQTARESFARYGVREVVYLLGKNLRRVAGRWARKFASECRRAMERLWRPAHGKDRPHILYVTARKEFENGETSRYRIANVRRALKHTAKTRFELLENGIWRDEIGISWADIIVIMRAEWSDQLEKLCAKARRYGVPTVFDVDDLVFLPEYASKFVAVLPAEFSDALPSFVEGFSRQEKTFRQSAFSTASTEFIAERMRREGKEAFVIPNGFNRTQQRIAERARKRPRPAGVRYIAYMSGTRTHDRDLRQAIPALTRVVQEYPDVRFRLIGYADETMLPPALAAKTDTVPFMSWKKLMRFAAENTINIAPLEVANPFCHAKSELKYFEAAIAGVPTVASPTDTFRRCIDSGVNGLLADSEEEWYAAFHTLLDDSGRYEDIRDEAMRRAQAEYSPRAVADKALTAYKAILRRPTGQDQASSEK